MFSHVILGANDLEASRKFYDAALATLGIGEPAHDPKGAIFTVPLPVFLELPIPLTVNRLSTAMALLSALPQRVRKRWKPGVRPASKQVVQTARTLLVFAKGRGLRCILPI